MSGFPAPHDLSPTDDGLRERLGALAATVPSAPDRVTLVAARARRRRHRQTAARSGAALACAAALVGGLLAVRAGRPSGDQPVGAADTTATTAAPDKTAANEPNVGCPVTVPPPGAADEVGSSVAKDDQGAGKATMLKAIGTITAVDDASITITPDDPMPDGVASLTAAFTPTTEFSDVGAPLTERPALAVGDRVVLGVETRDGGTPEARFVSIHADDQRLAPVGDAAIVKGSGDGQVSIRVGGSGADVPLAGGGAAIGAGDGQLSIVAADGTVTCLAAGSAGGADAPTPSS